MATVSKIQPTRAARKSEWLRSALAHHFCPEPGVENEIVVLATGIDQYIQEVFHHLAYNHDDDVVSREDFLVLCSVLGLSAEGARGPGDGQKEEDDDEGRDMWLELPQELPFKDFHARLCGHFRVRAVSKGSGENTVRLPVTEETELVEREIRLRWPRVRRRKCVSFDLTREKNSKRQPTTSTGPSSAAVNVCEQQCVGEAAALRELVEDLRSALQGSDARCLALEVALRRERASQALTRPHTLPCDLTSSSAAASTACTAARAPSQNRPKGRNPTPGPQQRCEAGRREGGQGAAPRQEARDLLLRELRLIRASRDGQLEEAMKFNQRLEEELHWAYQEVCRLKGAESALRKENAEIRRRAEEAREALRQGLQRVQLIQEQAQAVPELQSRVSQLETELQAYRSDCNCNADSTLESVYPIGAEDSCIRTECLQRAVEGRAASDEEEEERGSGEDGGKEGRRAGGRCCLVEVKRLICSLHDCSRGCQSPAIHQALLSQIHLHDNGLNTTPKDGRGGACQGHCLMEDRENQLDQVERRGECEILGDGGQQDTTTPRLKLLEKKLTEALSLLLKLRHKNVSCRALGKILIDTLDICLRSGYGPSQVLQVADALCVQLSSNELLGGGVRGGGRREGGRDSREETPTSTSSNRTKSGTNPLIISC